MIILDVEGKCKGFFEKNRKKLKGGSRSGIISNIWASILSKNGGYRVSMIKIKDYVRVGSLEEAYELNQKRSACILGGMLWTKICPGWDWIRLKSPRRSFRLDVW